MVSFHHVRIFEKNNKILYFRARMPAHTACTHTQAQGGKAPMLRSEVRGQRTAFKNQFLLPLRVLSSEN